MRYVSGEPNGYIFLRPKIRMTTSVTLPVPVVDDGKCNGCGKCKDICRFGAIAVLAGNAVVFEGLCRSCGGCGLVCPTGAIVERPKEIGVVEEGEGCGVAFVQGRLRIGEAVSPPLIREVKKRVPACGLAVVDCPPGTSCPVVESVRGTDFVLLVTEPTPFGLHDLTIAVETVRALDVPFAVVLNRADVGDERVHEYCRSENIDIIGEIPDDRRIAEAYSRGFLVAEKLADCKPLFHDLLLKVLAAVEHTRQGIAQ
ncbi:MAG: ATP-binding protein [Armatimonadota bacterium]|nr:ATP-binding protein [Armatimonadota bacterium]